MFDNGLLEGTPYAPPTDMLFGLNDVITIKPKKAGKFQTIESEQKILNVVWAHSQRRCRKGGVGTAMLTGRNVVINHTTSARAFIVSGTLKQSCCPTVWFVHIVGDCSCVGEYAFASD